MVTQVYTLAAVRLCLYWILVANSAGVQFNFSTPELGISEGGDLPSVLSIVKTGQQDEGVTITLHVCITSDTPNNNDYIPNEDHEYVFTRGISSLPIATQLQTDRSGEGIESFNITLLPPEGTGADNVQIVSPSIVTVIIIDDDSVVIGFSDSNSSVTFTEGGPSQIICADVKPEGLELDPFDSVPLNVMLNGLQTEVSLPVGSLTFSRTVMSNCKTISVTDNDVSDGTRSAHLLLTEASGTSVPVEVYPSKILLTILDDDVTNFTLHSPSSISLLEGESISGAIRLEKSNNTVLTYRATLAVSVMTDSADINDLAISESMFAPTDTELDIPLVAVDNSMFSEQPKEFLVDVGGVEAVDVTGALTNVKGMPLTVIVYENDLSVGFTEGEVTIPDGDYNHTVCAAIFDVTTKDIMPGQNLIFDISVSPASTHGGIIQPGLNRVTLNATDRVVCFDVAITCGDEVCRSGFIIVELTSRGNEGYSISYRQQNVTFASIPVQQGLSAGAAAAIAIVIVLTLVAIVVASVLVLVVVSIRSKRRTDEYNMNNNLSARPSNGDDSVQNPASRDNPEQPTQTLAETPVDDIRNGLSKHSSQSFLLDASDV